MDEPIPPRPLWVKVARGIIALVALTGLLYLSGIQQYFFFHRTPPEIKQSLLPSKVQGKHITIPVIVHILSGTVGSQRTEQDADRLVENANQIWNQANISFTIVDFLYPNVTNDDLRRFEHAPYDFISDSASHVPGAVNLYLTPVFSNPRSSLKSSASEREKSVKN